MSDPIVHLALLFERFPGIGPRQANRFVQYLLKAQPGYRREFIQAIQDLGGAVRQCESCMRFFAGEDSKICGICLNPQRDKSILAVVASDADLLALERSGTYRGLYFVLGGTISLASEKISSLRIPRLLESLPGRIMDDLSEIILAFPANPEGDATAIRVKEELQAHLLTDVRVTSLGRGLSTGSELEYADPDTLQSAFQNRR